MKKYIFCAIALCFCFSSQAQHIPNWQNKDLSKDSLFGVSTEKAYNELLKGKTPKPVIVAVIDAGVDTLHEDLKAVLWVNPKKKKFDNGSYGWSYLGSAKGNVQYDNLELTRQVRQLSADTARLNPSDLATYRQEKGELDKQKLEADHSLKNFKNYLDALHFFAKQVGKDEPSVSDLEAYLPKAGRNTDFLKNVISEVRKQGDYPALEKDIQGAIDHYKVTAEYQLNTAYDPRPLYVGDDYFNSRQRDYGSPDCMGPDPHHGTHVAGIIAGIRGNGLGADGIADKVQILAVRAVPDGDERDKDVANAIRYAADHGAKVINMSFGKDYSQDKKAVDEAVQYAIKKDVLLIQAAGNDNKNIDSAAHFPNPNYFNGGRAAAYIVVGASGLKGEKASFSNYGKTEVDVFAPGVQIYSSVPGSQYDYYDGTSMAAPVVAGLAALIREYYPKLKATQVKDIILKTVVRREPLKNYSATGGVVNAYNALQLAATY